MNLLFTLDENYIEQLKCCIRSIVRFPVKEGWDIYIIVQKAGEKFAKMTEEMNKTDGVRIHIMQADEGLFSSFPENIKYSRVVYY